MPTVEKLVPSETLLKQVILTQNGSTTTAIREFIQNGIDATRKIANGHMKFMVDGYHLTYEDNGIGLGSTRGEVLKNFFQFGESIKRGDDSQIGNFGIGRGQIIALTWDHDQNKQTGTHDIYSHQWHIFNVDIANLTAEIEECDLRFPGTKWEITSDKWLFYDSDVKSYIESNVRAPTNIKITVNDELVDATTEHMVEDNLFKYDLELLAEGSIIRVFDRGIFVCEVNDLPLSGSIVTKAPLALNFARNEIIENETWNGVRERICHISYRVAMTKFHSDVGAEVRRKMLAMYESDRSEYSDLKTLPIVMLANGQHISLDTIVTRHESGDPIYFSSSQGDVITEHAINAGHIVLYHHWDGVLERILKQVGCEHAQFKDAEIYTKLMDMSFELVEVSMYDELIEKIQSALPSLTRQVKVGIASTKAFIAWTDAKDYIAISQDYLKELHEKYTNPISVVLVLIECLAHEQAHDTSDQATNIHGWGFEKNQVQWMEKLNKELAEYIDRQI